MRYGWKRGYRYAVIENVIWVFRRGYRGLH